MRTTLNTIYSRIQTNLSKITTDMGKINDQISSGQQMSKISDEPVNLVSSLRYRSTIVELDQYTENIQNGTTLINAAESALTQMKDLALRAKTLAIQATDPGYVTANREAIAKEVKNLFEQSVSLGNTQVNGKYIFGGFRTTGYNDIEPAPFMIDKGDGHWVNGTVLNSLPTALTSGAIDTAASLLAALPPITGLNAGELLINGVDIGAVDLTTGGDSFGVNMAGADQLKAAISSYVGSPATADSLADGNVNTFSFDLNGVPISFATADLDTATAVSNKAIAAINLETANTGVTAFRGNGVNGGPVDAVVFKNAQAGDYTTITVANFTNVGLGDADPGFADFTKEIASATPTLTTLIAGGASLGAAGGEWIDFTLNGVRIAYSAAGGGATATAQEAVDAINAATLDTGVTALLGTGNNGGIADSVILTNSLAGDESTISLVGLVFPMTAVTGLADGLSQGADAAHNTGQLSLSAETAISITTSEATAVPPTDDILDLIGLGGGDIGNFDTAADGKLVYGYPISADELKINGLEVPAPQDDTISDIYAAASAAAKANAINSITTQTGVTAIVINAEALAAASVTAGTEPIRPTGVVSNTVIRANDLAINGTLISTEISSGAVTNGLNMAKADNAKTALYAESLTTGVLGRLTTLLPNNAAATTTGTGAAAPVSFTVNGTAITLNTGSRTANKTANDVADAINAVKDQTGVEARVGDGTNGGVSNSVVLFNSVKGNEDAIVIAGLAGAEPALVGLANINQAADAFNNTGEISLESEAPITISSPTISPGADAIINELGFSSQNVSSFGGHTSITSSVVWTGVGSNIAANSLYVNGTPVTANIIGGVPINGVNMDMAASAKAAIEAADPAVLVNLTTMTKGTAATTALAAADSAVSFKINGEAVTVSYPAGTSDSEIASRTIQAINAVIAKTGVQAYIGTGNSDGSPAGSAGQNVIVFKNQTAGNDAAITVSELTVNSGNNDLGFTDFSQAADATHNTGEITISSNTTFDLSTPLTPNDSILNNLGLGFGALSRGYSEKADGILYSTDGTGEGQASFGASPEYMDAGDLVINGVDIFVTPTAVLENDQTNSLIDAINTQTASTGVQATRGTDGRVLLTATDGRNIHVETTPHGEAITHLTNGERDLVTYGSLQLRSDRKFILETIAPTLNDNEPGLATLGLSGGETISGEPDDVAGDGKINVFSIHERTGSVRYAGDRVNDMEIKIGKTSTMAVGENGKTGVMDTTLFTTLKAMEDYLLGNNFTTVTGIHTATNTSIGLNSKTTGLEPASQLPSEDLFTSGSFTVSILDHDYYPPRTTALTVAVDPAIDTLESVTKRIDGIPRVKASWVDGRLTIESDDPQRYTIGLGRDSSNFLLATGISPEFMQRQGISQSLDNLDALMENLTRQVSNFGSRANRIDIQSQIYSTMTITTKENLSEVQDTDFIKAVMDLKTRETAYQAALSSAAKTMQLSLVDYL